jgi:parallel beta-helix repeat protein
MLAAFATVTTTADNGDNNSPTPGSLRAAIVKVNTSGSTGSQNEIDFSIGTGVQTISPPSALPRIARPVFINGYSESDASANTNGPGLADNAIIRIVIDGNSAGKASGLIVDASDSIIQGLAIGNFTQDGIFVTGSHDIVRGNFLGTDATGTAAKPNGFQGMESLGPNTTVGGTDPSDRNILSGNLSRGIQFDTGSTNGLVQGNFIGLDATGVNALGNRAQGVVTFEDGMTVGGTDPSARNIISGNDASGIGVFAGSDALVEGNFIGTDVTGTTIFSPTGGPLGNQTNGVETFAPGTTVGGTTSGARNIIGGNIVNGVALEPGSVDALVQGNYIGLDVNGSFRLGNGEDGVVVFSDGVIIGGTQIGARNVISGNFVNGIDLQARATNPTVQGNYIGTDATGLIGIGNGSSGIACYDPDVTIGGTDPGAGNVVSGSTGNGITLSTAVSNGVVLGNIIGLDKNGDMALPNRGDGINSQGTSTTIGGVTATPGQGPGNLISGNIGNGINLVNISGLSFASIQGNIIGLKKNGTDPQGNLGDGVRSTAFSTSIGGTSSGAGNVISGNTGNGITLNNTFGFSIATVQGNIIGLDESGTMAAGNGVDGINSDAVSTTIGGVTTDTGQAPGNLISGNLGNGITLGLDVSLATIQGNTIGLDISGTRDTFTGPNGPLSLGNKGDGVRSAAVETTVGGTAAGALNLLSGNLGSGITILNNPQTSSATIQGNIIGLDFTGSTPLGNGADGVNSDATTTTIGGPAPTLGQTPGNLISANLGNGITVGSDVTTTVVEGNIIGLDALGTTIVANSGDGVRSGATNTTIGGTDPGARNLISGNSGNGITLSNFVNSTALVVGNYIGVDITGMLAKENLGDGVNSEATSTTVGGTDAAAANLISGNFGNGITAGGHVVTILIEGNTIGLGVDGVIALGNGQSGVNSNAMNTTVGGTAAGAPNLIADNAGNGITIGPAGMTAAIQGNTIGLDKSGEIGRGNHQGGVSSSAKSTTINASNLISGNSGTGITLGPDGLTAVVAGNVIGLDKAGTKPLPNVGDGVNSNATSTTVGGTDPSAANVISGNAGNGITLGVGVATAMIQGNIIGLDATGTTDLSPSGLSLGNKGDGVRSGATSTTIDGTAAGARNIISGNVGNGITLNNILGSTALVIGNFIGLDKTGALALHNLGDGINSSTTSTTIGGTSAANRNVISGNFGNGITLNTTVTNGLVEGNIVGLDSTGTTVQANGGNGISSDAQNTTIGGTASGAANTISGNGGNGINLGTGVATALIQGNFVGTDPNGAIALGNGGNGINGVAGVATIGGVASGARNVISGNAGSGISVNKLTNVSSTLVVLGNIIGLDAAGTTTSPTFGNRGDGINSDAPQTTIGGTAAGSLNLIAGNGGNGITLGSDVQGALVEGNAIGVDQSGTSARPNLGDGVRSYAAATTIGGTTTTPGAAPGNIISGNFGNGISLLSTVPGSSASIQGNLIGLDKTGAIAVKNLGDGVNSNAAQTSIGGTAAGSGNVVSGNDGNGITLGTAVITANVQGNVIGLDKTGASAVPNKGDGIRSFAATTTIGGAATTAGQAPGNIISGNRGNGVALGSNVTTATILGNLIGLDGTGLIPRANSEDGINSDAGTTTIGGPNPGERNIVAGNNGNGITLGSDVSSAVVKGNYVGLGVDGSTLVPNKGDGVRSFAGMTTIGGMTTSEGNVISGNAGSGINLIGVTTALIQGNIIGLDKGGSNVAPNLGDGVRSSATQITIGGSTTTPGTAPGNVISGNAGNGIALLVSQGASPTALVVGNVIGLNQAGTAIRANSQDGITSDVAGTTIGGTAAGLRNLVSGNSGNGITLGSHVSGAVVEGNYVGLGADGATVLGNLGDGVRSSATNATIGGSTTTPGAAPGNVISGNAGNGIALLKVSQGASPTALVVGNIIGLNQAGTAIRANSQDGITSDVAGTTIGGTAAGLRNLVSGNSGNGITLGADVTNALVQGNYVGLGVDGATVLGNLGDGVRSFAASTTIGGATAAAGNVISGNAGSGINLGAGVTTALVQGNIIGLDKTGTLLAANRSDGVRSSATTTTIGGSATTAGAAPGNVISGNAGNGIVLGSGVGTANVQGNIVGLDITGSSAVGNLGNGLQSSAIHTTIGGTGSGDRNILSGNAGNGVAILKVSSSSTAVVQGNIIGLDATGAKPLPNSADGVNSDVAATTIGGPSPAARNLISGNAGSGITFGSDVSTAIVLGNYVGLDVSGAIPLGNKADGVRSFAASTTIGGPDAASRNIISGNAGSGINLGAGVVNATIQGNYIGLDVGGLNFAPNLGDGVRSSAATILIGGTTSGDANIISGNSGNGITLLVVGQGTSAATVQGNIIGLDVSGMNSRANSQDGINSNARNTTIGGLVSAARNLISGNGGNGISLGINAVTSAVLGNYIGLDVMGTTAHSNVGNGVLSDAASTTIGGPSDGARNIISGNLGNGVALGPNAGNSLVQNNYIGTDVSGTKSSKSLGNLSNGILDAGVNAAAGSTTLIMSNTVSGNLGNGIVLSADVASTMILKNIIGLDASGVNPLGNTGDGVMSDAQNSPSGTATVISGNTISANVGSGINLGDLASSTLIANNRIGTSADGLSTTSPSGARLGNSGDGILSNGTNSMIGGTTAADRNIVAGNAGDGIAIGSLASNNTVQGNFIGTDLNGNAISAFKNGGNGVRSAALSTLIGGTVLGAGNVIVNNDGNGIAIESSAKANVVQANLIGMDAHGMSSGNRGDGIRIESSPNNQIGGVNGLNADGTINTMLGNLIVSNFGNGIEILFAGAVNNTVQGNRIGTSMDGGTALGNLLNGVVINSAASTMVGGTAAGARNIISANGGSGVAIIGNLAASNVVQGNLIGTTGSGTQALGNGGDGVTITYGGNNMIGGPDPASRNVIAANSGSGVMIVGSPTLGRATGNVVQNDWIGVGFNGDSNFKGNALGNRNDGITVSEAGTGDSGTMIRSNVVSANGGAGIQVSSSAQVTNAVIQDNRIGTNSDGSSATDGAGKSLGNNFGIFLNDALGNLIGGGSGGPNIISGNHSMGIQVFRVSNSGPGNTIVGNRIGTDASGTRALVAQGGGIGIFLNDNAKDVGDLVSNNVISANGMIGLEISGQGSRNTNVVVGNKIGSDINGAPLNGTSPITVTTTTAPQQIGVLVQNSFGNTIGGLGSDGNVIANNLAGVEISGINPHKYSTQQVAASGMIVDRVINNMIKGNLIGIFLDDTTDNLVTGNTILGNASTGITLLGTVTQQNVIQNNTIGSPDSPNGTGIYIERAQNNSVQSNNVSNNSLVGVYLFDHALGNVVQSNTIKKNHKYGIFLFNSAGNAESIRRAKNKLGGNTIADFREFTGKVTGRMGNQPPATPNGPKVHSARARHHGKHH